MRTGGTRSAVHSLSSVKDELKRLRQGWGLGNTKAVRERSPALHQLICGDLPESDDGASEVVQIQRAVRAAIAGLNPDLRQYALVDFNLDEQYPGRTLTERQEKLAAGLKCVAKTVRRRANPALDAVAVALVSAGTQRTHVAALDMPPIDGIEPPQAGSWQEKLCAFWGLTNGDWVDVVCSELPEEYLPDYASPEHHNYLRYAKFADLDSLIYVGRRFVQALPTIGVREFPPSWYSQGSTNTLLVLGGPPYNEVFRKFQDQQLRTVRFESRQGGEDDPLLVEPLNNRLFGPRWTSTNELLADVLVFARLTLTQGTKVFLAAGCLTLGVYGAAMCFLHGELGARNVAYIDALLGSRDFVLVAEVSRIGSVGAFPNMSDFTNVGPMLVIARDKDNEFRDILVDNTEGRDYRPGVVTSVSP